MLAIVGIALVALSLFSPVTVPTFIVWLFGIGLVGFWIGKSIAEPVKKKEVSKDGNRH